MTTGRARLSQDNIQWCSRCRQTPFRPLMAALAATGRKETNPRPESEGRHEIRLPRTDLPLTDSPGSTGTNGRARTPTVACAERAGRKKRVASAFRLTRRTCPSRTCQHRQLPVGFP